MTASGFTVHESPFHRLTEEGGFLRLVRSAEPYPDLATIDSEYLALVAAMDRFASNRLPLLVDLRNAKGRNDPGFESTLNRWRKKSLMGHDPLVVLVRTTLGRMHVERHMREDGLEAIVTTDEGEAAAHVRAGSQLRP